MIGWIKLHRKLLVSDMYQDLNSVQRDVLLQCLLAANHQPKKWGWMGEIFECQPGQFVTSLDSLKNLCAKGTSIRNVRTALVKLEKWQFLTNESTKTGRLITIIKWGTYQDLDNESDKAVDKEVTKSRQTGDKQVTTNKNVKNVKNEKKKDKTFLSDSQEIRLSELLLSEILARNPNNKKPNIQSWAKHIDLMIRIDKREPSGIQNVILWCQKDSFWQDNILSTSKLREKYDALYLKMNNKRIGGKQDGKFNGLSTKDYSAGVKDF